MLGIEESQRRVLRLLPDERKWDLINSNMNRIEQQVSVPTALRCA